MLITTAQNVLHVDRDAVVSEGQVAEELNVSQMTILKAFHEQLFYPYYLQRVLDIMHADFPARD
jgi:hypothetical protein